MVGVAPSANGDELSSKKNPMIKQMLKQRENHARLQDHDYSHVFRRKTKFEMFRLAAIAMAIEFAYAAETSFVTPILLEIGINHQMMTMAWGLSPLLGFFISPLLGPISDRCRMKLGRRRPIISVLSFGILLGLILVPYGKKIGILLGDEGYTYNVSSIVSTSNYSVLEGIASNYSVLEGSVSNNSVLGGSAGNYSVHEGSAAALSGPSASNYKIATIITILGMILLDFDADTCQTPARTYLLDMCIPEDQPKALTYFTLFAGIGGTIGYGIGGIDWASTKFGAFFGGNVPTVFGMVTIIFIICYFITVTTFREIPLRTIEKDELLTPLSDAAIKLELKVRNANVLDVKENPAIENHEKTDASEKLAPNGSHQNGDTPNETYQNGDAPTAIKPVSLTQYLRSIFVMPQSIRMLALTNLFCWMGHVTYCLYFTDFVGEAVFHGDPKAAPTSEEFKLYDAGVRFGCWGMSIYALSCSIYSLSVTRLMKWVGAKTVYITGIMYFGVGMLILGIWPTKWGVLFFSNSAGVLYGTLFTMPYILVANYHAKNCFRVHNGVTVPLTQARGLGTDVAIISSVVFVAQLIVSLCVGPLVEWLNTTCAILYASFFLSCLAATSAMFVLYI